MWFKSILMGLGATIMLSGCSYTYQEFKDGYKAAKVVYKDIKYVVYEVQEEKDRIDNGGFGVEPQQADTSTPTSME